MVDNVFVEQRIPRTGQVDLVVEAQDLNVFDVGEQPIGVTIEVRPFRKRYGDGVIGVSYRVADPSQCIDLAIEVENIEVVISLVQAFDNRPDLSVAPPAEWWAQKATELLTLMPDESMSAFDAMFAAFASVPPDQAAAFERDLDIIESMGPLDPTVGMGLMIDAARRRGPPPQRGDVR